VDENVASVRRADIVIGIPSYNNARTIGHVVRAANAGLLKYFPQFDGLIINSDGGSTDGTAKAVLEAQVEDSHLLLLETPKKPVNRLSVPYHGIPGKGSAFRNIFEIALRLGAKACAVVDSDLRSITPEWIDLLIRPVLLHGYDLVTPYYHRHKYDGTITNNLVYPLTRALYGKRIRQPIGGDFGLSARLLSIYTTRNDWESDVARYGIDIWLTTLAVVEDFKVCQSFLGAKLHDPKDPGSDLSAMLMQVMGSLFALMEEYEDRWPDVEGSAPVDLFGFRYDVGVEPVAVTTSRMLDQFRHGLDDLTEIYEEALEARTFQQLRELAGDSVFLLPDEVWVRVVYDFACRFHRAPVGRGQLLRSLTPLYMGRVASMVEETRDMGPQDFEERMERACRIFEEMKPYLIQRWNGAAPLEEEPKEVMQEVKP